MPEQIIYYLSEEISKSIIKFPVFSKIIVWFKVVKVWAFHDLNEAYAKLTNSSL